MGTCKMCELPRFDLNFIGDVLGQQGPLTVNMGVFEHNFFLEDLTEEEKFEKDSLVICPEGGEITTEALNDALEQFLADPLVKEYIYADRSYFYEGMRKDREGTWCILWGS